MTEQPGRPHASLFAGAVDEFTDAQLRPRVLDDIDAERDHRKARLAAAYRVFARFGYDNWVTGHITVRDPEHHDRFWVNSFARSWHLMRASDLVLVDREGAIVEGRGQVNAAAFAIHSEIHRSRPDAVAVAHAHSPAAQAWSIHGQTIAPLTQDCCAFFEDHEVFDAYSGVVYGTDEGAAIAEALGGSKALLLRHHGLLTVGGSVDEAAFWLHLLEQCCALHLRIVPSGRLEGVARIDDRMARHAHDQVGQPLHGWLGFQPLFELEVARDPSFVG